MDDHRARTIAVNDATYAAWNDLLLWGKAPTEENILHEILNRWHESKKRFPKDRWLKAIGWMKEAGFNEAYVQHLTGPDSMVVGIK